MPTPSTDVAATQIGTNAQAAPSTADITSAAACENVSDAQIKAITVPDKIVAMGVALLNIGGIAGMAGYPNAPGQEQAIPRQ